jgi:antitoxin component YwqK of YwqJK toxin-antitoxin module
MRTENILKILTLGAVMVFFAYIAGADGTVEHEYWPGGELRVTKAFDDMGDLREVSYYREDGKLEQHEKYDAHGHKIEESYYDGKGKLRTSPDGWAAMRAQYKDGQMRQEAYYGADGKIMERKQYSAGGNLIAKQYVGDGDPMPEEEYNPIPPVTGYETVSYYDSYGRPQGTTSIDRDPDWWGWPGWWYED